MTSDSDSDAVDAIAAALARLRPGRGPRPGGDGPWTHGGPFGAGDPFAHRGGQPHGHGGMGAHGMPDDPHVHGGHGHGPHSGRPVPPWAAGHGRFAGPARLRLLAALAAASTPLSVSELAETIGVDQPRASRLVQQCVEFGLVRREADPDDARRTRIVLTDDGRAILSRFRGDRREAIERALADFTDAERKELARLLAKLADGWPR